RWRRPARAASGRRRLRGVVATGGRLRDQGWRCPVAAGPRPQPRHFDGPAGCHGGAADRAGHRESVDETPLMAIPSAIDLDLQAVRRQFPALGLKIDGQPAVYLDNPAGTQVPQRVIDRTTDYWRTMNAHQGGSFATSRRSDALMADVRQAAATFVNAASADEIVFGPNMTTLTFAVSRAIGRELRPGDEILVTRLEHDANVSPWLALQEQGVIVRFVDIAVPECTLDIEDFERQLGPRTRLGAVTHASNAVGTIPDLAAISRAAHAAGAGAWGDAVHFGPPGPVDA